MSEIQYSVEVKDVEKHFKVYMDKGSTLKERAIFHNRNRHGKQTDSRRHFL